MHFDGGDENLDWGWMSESRAEREGNSHMT